MKHTLSIVLPLLTACLLILPSGLHADDAASVEDTSILLDDFNNVDTALKRWMTVNDNVMGGRSKGGPSFANGLLAFKGSTNTNGGGFSSIRTRPAELDLSGTAGLLLRIKGDGRTYQASLRSNATNGRWRIPFRAEFETIKDEWTTVFVPYDAMTPTFWGREIRDNPPILELDKVQSLGLMIYNKEDGPFHLQVDWIKAAQHAPEADPTE